MDQLGQVLSIVFVKKFTLVWNEQLLLQLKILWPIFGKKSLFLQLLVFEISQNHFSGQKVFLKNVSKFNWEYRNRERYGVWSITVHHVVQIVEWEWQTKIYLWTARAESGTV